MGVDLPPEKEEALGAIIDRHDNRYEDALTGRKYPTGWAENDMPWHIGEARPTQIACRRCPVGHFCQAGIGSILIRAVKVTDETHR